MGGSFGHVVVNSDPRNGKEIDLRLLDDERLVGMLETGGDVYEAVEEMYGMIWWLATNLSEAQWPQQPPVGGHQAQTARLVLRAQQHYREGLEISPGRVEEGESLPGWVDQ